MQRTTKLGLAVGFFTLAASAYAAGPRAMPPGNVHVGVMSAGRSSTPPAAAPRRSPVPPLSSTELAEAKAEALRRLPPRRTTARTIGPRPPAPPLVPATITLSTSHMRDATGSTLTVYGAWEVTDGYASFPSAADGFPGVSLDFSETDPQLRYLLDCMVDVHYTATPRQLLVQMWGTTTDPGDYVAETVSGIGNGHVLVAFQPSGDHVQVRLKSTSGPAQGSPEPGNDWWFDSCSAIPLE